MAETRLVSRALFPSRKTQGSRYRELLAQEKRRQQQKVSGDKDAGAVGNGDIGERAERQQKMMKQFFDLLARADLRSMLGERTSTRVEVKATAGVADHQSAKGKRSKPRKCLPRALARIFVETLAGTKPTFEYRGGFPSRLWAGLLRARRPQVSRKRRRYVGRSFDFSACLDPTKRPQSC